MTLVIFGITGNLAQHKLLPALYHLMAAEELPEQIQIIGVSRREVSLDETYKQLRAFVGEEGYDATIEQRLREHTEMYQMDLSKVEDYQSLLVRVQELEQNNGDDGCRLYYLSIPSNAFRSIVHLLGQTGHNVPCVGSHDAPRLLVEKPFGYDLASAWELIETLDEYFSEEQIYRIDHYVAKETVQNILTFRFYNPLFESVWNSKHVERISVVAHEQIDIEGRTNFYEQTGALRDLVQSHLLQLLAIVTMERPSNMDSDCIHAKKLKLLRAVRPISSNEVASKTCRGQYVNYRDEVNNKSSLTETFARLELQIENVEWAGVPITLETGKALNEKRTEITVCFRRAEDMEEEQNKLIFRIQPHEGITIRLQVKRPGLKTKTDTADMSLDYATSFIERSVDAYERVIVDAIRGDQTLFASAAEVIRSWEIVGNVLDNWSHSDEELTLYEKGSTGPMRI